MDKQIIFLSGLPRTGSTLINSIISQNKDIFCEGNSPLPNLLYGVNYTCDNFAHELLIRNNRESLRERLMKATIETYYENVPQTIALSMNKAWTQDYHLNLLPHLSDRPRILITLRPITEIAMSFVYVRKKNDWILPEHNLFEGEPIQSALLGVANALRSKSPLFLFGTYSQLLAEPQSFMNQACDFWEIPRQEWDFDKIKNPLIENDEAFAISGLHEVRSKLEARRYEVTLSRRNMNRAKELDEALWHDYEQAKKLKPEAFIA